MSDKKNLLNEATIRRFMKLATLEPLAETFVENNIVEDETEELEESEETEELEEADIDEERKYTASQRAARRGQPHDTSAGALRTAKEKEEEEELKKTKALAKVREELVEPPLKEWHQNTLYNRLLKEWIKK